MIRILLIALGVALAIGVLAIVMRDPPPTAAERAVQAWLTCEECRDGQREAVIAAGQQAVPALARVLRSGLTPADSQAMRDKYAQLYQTIRSTGLDTSLYPLRRDAYVGRAISNHVASVQMRAATVLSEIGGGQARSALRAALSPASVHQYRSDVLATLRVANAVADTARFRGTITPAVPAFGDTVVVIPPAFEPFNGDELVEVDGSPFSATDVLLSRQPGRIEFLAASPTGQRVVTIRNVGTTTHSQYTTLTMRSLMDATDRRTASCVDLSCFINGAQRYATLRAPVKHLLVLWRGDSNRDTTDYVRFEPASRLSVTATLAWDQSTRDLNLNWIDCVTRATVGNNDGATSARPERSVVNIPAGACWILIAKVADTVTRPPVFAVLQLSP